MHLRSALFAVFAVMLLLSCKEKRTLTFDPVPGSKYEVVMTTETTTQQEVMGEKMEIDQETAMTMLFEFAKADGDSKILKIIFKNMKTSQKTAGNEILLDTESPDSTSPGISMLKAMMGSEFTLTINPRGEVTDVKGMDAMVNRMMAVNTVEDTLTRQQVAASLQNFMNDDVVKNMVDQSLNIFPANPVKEGDSWDKKMVITQPMPMNIATTYTLEEVSDKVATIDLKSAISPGEGGMELMGMKIETNLSGKQTGTMEVEPGTGIALSTDIKQDITGNMKMMEQEIPMKITSVIKMKARRL